MKKWVSIALLAIVAVGIIGMEGCIVNGDTPPVTNLTYTVVTSDNGASITLNWNAPADADPDDYVVSIDGVDNVPVETTTETITTAGAEIEVFARYNEEKSTAVSIDLAAVETVLDVYTVDDPSPDHPSGFGFTPSGTAQEYAVSNEANWPDIDFYIASGHVLTAPMDHLPTPLNGKGSAASVETDAYDDLDIVMGPGNYSTQRSLSINGVYGLWLDDSNDGYDITDHFGKAYVTGISGEQVSMTVAYQNEAGLRWTVVD